MISTLIVYVIGSAESPVKIGLASSLQDRLVQLQIGNPDALVCHHFVRVPASAAKDLERAAHAMFAARHRRGEWFDVHWQEAAAALDVLAAAEDTGQSENLFAVLRAEHGMKAAGADAVWDYLDRQERGDPYVPHANGYILKRVGTAAYAAFSLVVAQQKRLSGLSASESHAARSALAEAINCLCNFRARYSRQLSGVLVLREVAACEARLTSTRPSSLPPLRRTPIATARHSRAS